MASLLASAAPAYASHAPETALEDRVLAELADFTSWLDANGADGFIGEVGWPGGRVDSDRWNHVAELWMDQADEAGLWVTAWATGEWWPQDYELAIYTASSNQQLDGLNTQAAVLESHLDRPGRGINVAGAEFAAPTTAARSSFSNKNPGTYGIDYHYDSAESFAFLASRGIRTIRMPFRWERIQPVLGGPLSKPEVRRLAGAVRRARDAGIGVVLDMHNYGAYYRHRDGAGRRCAVGTRACPASDLADVWRRLSRRFASNPAVVGYGLMNEPIGIPGTSTTTAARRWERISQRVLDAIRRRGDAKLILVPGYEWSGAQSWRKNHADAWIEDPMGNFRYEAHHYWDHDHSGKYRLTYDEELQALAP